MKQKQVDHYGAHLSPNGLWFLLQEDEQNERGILNVKSNLSPKTYRSQSPTHSIRLDAGKLDTDSRNFLEWMKKDRVGQLLLPNPDAAGQVIFIEENDPTSVAKIHHATALTSPTSAPVRPSWLMTMAEARAQSRLTNVQPFIITEVSPKWMAQYGSKISTLFRLGTRPLILIGSGDVVLPREIKKRMKMTAFHKASRFSKQQLQNIGSVFLKEWMTNARQ